MHNVPPTPRATGCTCTTPPRVYHQETCPACGRVALHDIHDAQAFVNATITKHVRQIHPAERDDIHSQALEILVRMARNYQPGLGGRQAENSSFAGYAAKYLPGKITDAVHRLRDDRVKVNPDGTRTWTTQPQVSIQQLAQDGPNTLDRIPQLHATDQQPDGDTPRRQQLLNAYIALRVDGHPPADAAEHLRLVGLERREFERITAWIAAGALTADSQAA